MFQALRNIFSSSKQVADAQIEVPSAVGELLSQRNPPRRGTIEIIRAYKEIPSLRVIVQAIAQPIAATEWQLKAQLGGQRRAVRNRPIQRASFASRAKALKRLKQMNALLEIEDHPMLDVLEFGSPLLSGTETFQVAQSHLELKGEAYLVKHRDALGVVDSLWVLPPHWVVDTPSSDDGVYEIRVRGVATKMPAADIIALRDPDPENPYGRGTGIAEALGDEIDTDENAAEFIKAFFHNNAMPAAIVTLKGANKDAVRAARAKWEADFRGTRRSSRVHFTGVEHMVNTLSQTFEEMSMVELRQATRKIVRETFGVPPEMVGVIENSNRATIEAAAAIMAEMILVPRLERWRQAFQRQLAPEYDERLIVDYVSPVPEDKAFRLEAAKANPAALTRAEWRALSGHESHGEVDDVYVLNRVFFERRVTDPRYVQLSEEPDIEKALTPVVPTKMLTKTYGLDDIPRTIEAARPAFLVERVVDLWDEELAAWAKRVLREVGSAISFDILNPFVQEHLSRFAGEKIKSANDTTRAELAAMLEEGVKAGEGIPELKKRIKAVFKDATSWRAEAIARTEVLGSSSFATQHAFEISGVVDARKWIAVQDLGAFTGARPHSQTELNGQVRPIRVPFAVDGHQAMHPGGFGVAKHDINCRCTIVAVIDGDEPSEAESQAEYEHTERRRREWEREAEKQLGRGFTDQEREVLKVLDGIV